VSADADRAALDAAWGSIPQSREETAALGTFTRSRVERIIAIVVGIGCLVVGAQGFIAALGPPEEHGAWHTVLMAVVFGSLAVMLIAWFVGRGVRFFGGLFAILFIVVLVLWPVATAGSSPEATDPPWIFYLINVATVAAVIAFPFPLQLTWTIATPLLYGLVRLIQGGFTRDFWIAVSLNASFALILGGILMVLGWVFRSVAINVDETRSRAVSSYAAAAAADAVEQERVAVGALMHDSVLAALIASARADSPRERSLAVAMSRDALTRLANAERDAEMGSDEPVDLEQLALALEAAAAELGDPLVVTRRGPGLDRVSVPGVVERALVLAATQALTNAIQHAGASGLTVIVEAHPSPAHVLVRVGDTGAGFDVDAIPDDRLGIRASIFARVTAVGGSSSIESSHRGTVVTLEWIDAT
jgi:signal transduction histidine kinase